MEADMKQAPQRALITACAALLAMSMGFAPASAAAQADGYRTGNWSGWGRKDGVDYRYNWGWNPQDRRYERQVDAIFELRNGRNRKWNGAVRSVDCTRNVLAASKSVTLQPGARTTVKFVTANCGTRAKPWFKPDIVTSSSY
jgi:hypothetical protein